MRSLADLEDELFRDCRLFVPGGVTPLVLSQIIGCYGRLPMEALERHRQKLERMRDATGNVCDRQSAEHLLMLVNAERDRRLELRKKDPPGEIGSSPHWGGWR